MRRILGARSGSRGGWLLWLCWWLAAAGACAHPFLQNSWQVVVEDGRLAMRATATLREVMVVQGLESAQLTQLPVLQNAVSNHAAYMASNLVVEVDGVVQPIEVLDHQLLLGDSAEPEDSERYPDLTHAGYDLECLLPAGAVRVRFRHTTLRGHAYAPGIPWEPSYVMAAVDRERRALGQDVLRPGGTVSLALQSPGTDGTEADAGVANQGGHVTEGRPEGLGGTFGAFLRHGVHHVVTGYDHLLFLAALALASRSWGRLMAIIGVFTVAHSLTVTLAAGGWVRVPASIVEPVIAGSIVWVALENVLAPRRAAGGGRLAVAFGFGLVHGLGFAGGLREVLESMPGVSLVVAVAAFCIGVELGHVAVGAPLYGILRALRGPAVDSATPGADDPASLGPSMPAVLRWGSLAVALGGAWYLWAALRSI